MANFVIAPTLQKMNRYFNTSSLLLRLQTSWHAHRLLCGASRAIVVNVLDIHVVHAHTSHIRILIYYSYPGGSINFRNSCIVNNEDGG